MTQERGSGYDFWLRVLQECATRGWSRSELARRAGVNRSTIARLGSSTDRPYAPTVRALARALDIDPVEAAVLAGLIPADVDDDDEGLGDELEIEIRMIADSDLPESAKRMLIQEASHLRSQHRSEQKELARRQAAERRQQIATWMRIASGASSAEQPRVS